MSNVSNQLDDKKINSQLEKFKKNKQFKQALEYCHDILKDNPASADLRVRIGDIHLERHLDIYHSGQYVDDAITEYQCALEQDIDSPLIHYKLGVALYYKGEWDKAISHFDWALERNDKYADCYYMLAKTLYKKDNLSEATERVQKAIKYSGLKSSRARLLYFLILSQTPCKTFAQKIVMPFQFLASMAILPFDFEAIKHFIDKLSYVKFIPIMVEGYFLERSRKVRKAIELYINTIDEAPGFLPLYIFLGDAYKEIGEMEDAINEYKMALWLDPVNISAYKSLCAAYEELGDYDNAVLTYEKLIDLYPNDAILYSNLANIFYLKGDIQQAISHYHAAITLNPNKNWTSVIAQTLGYVFQEANNNSDAAISAYQSASLLNPNDIDIYVNLGSAFYEKGDYNNALAVYKVALSIDPNNARIHCNLGYLFWGKGLLDEAIKEYDLAIKLDPSYDIAYNNLGVIYLDDLGRVQRAIECFEQAAKHNPNYALAYYNIGRGMALKGDNVEAARLFQIALDINSVTNEMDEKEIKDRINNLFD